MQRLVVVWCLSLCFVGAQGTGYVRASPEQSAPATAPTPADAAYQRGVALLAQGALSEAATAFDESLRLAPLAIPPLLGLADVALKQGAPQRAEELLKKALSRAPHYVEAHAAWGRYLVSQRRLSEAEEVFKYAITLAPDAVFAHMDLGDLYRHGLQKPREAIAAYRAALALDASHAEAHYALGTALVMAGETESAQAALGEAGRLSPSNPLPFQALGQLHRSQKDYTKALQAFAQALTAQPNYVPAYLARGDIFVLQAQRDKALAEYSAAVRLAPRSPAVYVKMGLIHEQLQQRAEAERAYRAALDLDASQTVAYNNLAWMAAEQRTRLDEALGWARKAVELAPTVPQFLDTLAWVYRARGELEKAADTLTQATALEPPQAMIWYHLGVVQAELQHNKEAIEALQRALAVQADFPEAEDARRRLAALAKP